MGIPHGSAWIAVTQQLLHFVERMPVIDQEAGKGMPQVMDAHTVQSQLDAQFVPEVIDVG